MTSRRARHRRRHRDRRRGRAAARRRRIRGCRDGSPAGADRGDRGRDRAGSRSSPTRRRRSPTPTAPSRRRSTRFGRLDALVLNAGIGGRGLAARPRPGRVRARSSRPTSPERSSSPAQRSRICSSRAARSSPSRPSRDCAPAPSSLAYCSSKAALAMLTQCIALDHGPAGVRANCVCPGWVRTPMADGEMDALGARLDSPRGGRTRR